jgi:hypothetical protein
VHPSGVVKVQEPLLAQQAPEQALGLHEVPGPRQVEPDGQAVAKLRKHEVPVQQAPPGGQGSGEQVEPVFCQVPPRINPQLRIPVTMVHTPLLQQAPVGGGQGLGVQTVLMPCGAPEQTACTTISHCPVTVLQHAPR